MGSDTPPHLLFEAVAKAAEHFDTHCTFIVLATQPVIEQLLALPQHKNVRFHPTADVIAMSDDPLTAIRHKKGSSLVTGIRLLKKRQLDAFVSAGNTGALIAASTLTLPMLPGIHRPALLAVLPTAQGSVAVLDVGGNVYCKAHHLVEFAHMGAAYQRCSQGLLTPRVGLLNIGAESKKGTSELRQAYQALETYQESGSIVFHGNIEGREVFHGQVDVLVTDGFTGNVFLKSIEGMASFILETIARASPSAELQEALSALSKRFHYKEYPGAIVCGVEGVVVKCHGDASPTAFFNCIQGAVTLIQRQLLQQIKKQL